ncbi:MAG TPA: SRPBCC domain-containing protein [Gemmatimonadaceae bacterium]|nr:SRPBCC domain-containing protein [Gemmatimonadaceae bacterium]
MTNFTTTITVPQSPEQVFHAINDVRGWWTGNIDGRTDVLGAEFTYRFAQMHHTTQKITTLAPNEKVVWHVTESAINFPNRREWEGTDIVFELAPAGDGTQLRFTHEGLVPSCGCYEACRDGWTFYIEHSLRALITTGKGRAFGKDYTKTFAVEQTPEQVFAAINDVRGWWSEDIEGDTDRAGAVFTFRHRDLHRSKHAITDFEPGKKVVWHIDDADITFVKDRTEWNGTDVEFLIRRKGDNTEVRFTHVGLVPGLECYGDCSGAWAFHLDSLRSLITTGRGEPNRKER